MKIQQKVIVGQIQYNLIENLFHLFGRKQHDQYLKLMLLLYQNVSDVDFFYLHEVAIVATWNIVVNILVFR